LLVDGRYGSGSVQNNNGSALESLSELLAACRTCGALTGIDLSGCTKWTNFIQIHYRRQETSTKPARYINIYGAPLPLCCCVEKRRIVI
jgi:hypothetical protein